MYKYAPRNSLQTGSQNRPQMETRVLKNYTCANTCKNHTGTIEAQLIFKRRCASSIINSDVFGKSPKSLRNRFWSHLWSPDKQIPQGSYLPPPLERERGSRNWEVEERSERRFLDRSLNGTGSVCLNLRSTTTGENWTNWTRKMTKTTTNTHVSVIRPPKRRVRS